MISVRALYEAVSEAVLGLSPGEGRILFANRAALELLEARNEESVLGLSPAEAFQCARRGEPEHDRYCGLCAAVRGALEGRVEARESRIDRGGRREALELLIRATPLEREGGPLIVLSALDLRHAKRRQILERVFFHDIINTAQGLKMMVELFPLAGPQRQAELGTALQDGLVRLLEEIRQQKELAAAERNDLRLRVSPVDSLGLLEELRDTISRQGLNHKREIVIDPGSERIIFHSDRTLLSRVLTAMIRNGVEASTVGDRITLGCGRRGQEIELWVHNPQSMPEDVQRQVFQRSFSTRGPGRGLGTYSMRLLSERYLNGGIAFRSSPAEGTRFYARYPLSGPG